MVFLGTEKLSPSTVFLENEKSYNKILWDVVFVILEDYTVLRL